MAKAAAKPAAKKAAAPKKAMTKSAFVAHLATKAEITKKQVDVVLDEIIEAKVIRKRNHEYKPTKAPLSPPPAQQPPNQ